MAIANQARLAIITSLLVAILLHTRLGITGAQDEKAWAKQEKRQKAKVDDPDDTDRPDWTVSQLRYTAKMSRHVLRFFKHGFLKPASPGLYERELAACRTSGACRPSWTKIDRFRFFCAKSGALDLDETSNFRVATKCEAKSDRLLGTMLKACL